MPFATLSSKKDSGHKNRAYSYITMGSGKQQDIIGRGIGQ